jgi:hypothetical protein
MFFIDNNKCPTGCHHRPRGALLGAGALADDRVHEVSGLCMRFRGGLCIIVRRRLWPAPRGVVLPCSALQQDLCFFGELATRVIKSIAEVPKLAMQISESALPTTVSCRHEFCLVFECGAPRIEREFQTMCNISQSQKKPAVAESKPRCR